MAKSLLVRPNSMMGITDPKGLEQYNKAIIAIDNLVQKQEEKGEPAYNLFNPNHEDYVGLLINSFKRTALQIAQDQISSIGDPSSGSDTSVPTEAEAGILRGIVDALGLGDD